PALSRPAVAGAVLSTVATVVELAAVLAATSRPALIALAKPLSAMGIVACIYAALFTVKNIRHDVPSTARLGSAFSLKAALVFALTFTAVLLASAALNSWLGKAGVILASAVTGFADAHATAFSVGSLVTVGKLTMRDSVLPCLAGLTTNTITKAVLAMTSGGRHFSIQVLPGLAFVILSGWITVALLYL